jgi:hypothetical protein
MVYGPSLHNRSASGHYTTADYALPGFAWDALNQEDTRYHRTRNRADFDICVDSAALQVSVVAG